MSHNIFIQQQFVTYFQFFNQFNHLSPTILLTTRNLLKKQDDNTHPTTKELKAGNKLYIQL